MLFDLAWALWNGKKRLSVAELLHHSDLDTLNQFASLLAALTKESAAVDFWLAQWETEDKT